MRNVSIGFLEEIVKPSRTVDAKIVINGHTITSNDIISYEITSSLTDNDMPTIGSAVASSVKFEVTKSSLPMIYVGQKLEFYAGLLVNGAMEWVRVGTFKTTAEYVNKKKLTVEIEAFDEMFWLGNTIYESDLSYPTTVASMMSELVTKYGLIFSSDMYAFEERRTHESMEAFTYGQLEAYWYQPRITDDIVFHVNPTQQEYSIRSVLSQIALLTSSNVVGDSFGEIAFRFLRPTEFEITGENYIDYTRLSEGDIYISQLISRNPELEQTFVSGANTGVAITVENSGIVSQVQNDDIRNRVYPLAYTPYSMTCQGMPHLEIGDTVRFVEVDDTESVLFIVNYSFEYNGGFRNKFTVKSPEKDNVETTPLRSASSTVSGETIRLTNQTLEQAIANASELITGNQGGHVVTVRDEVTGKPQEILILVDSDDVNTATKLWRWNASGLGFSNTGYNGTYELAMTSDGRIVADAIDVTELSAIVANLGTVTAGRIQDIDNESYWDLNTKQIALNVNSLKINALPVATQNYATSVASGKVDNNQLAVFNALTNFGYSDGLYIQNGQLYVNASYIGAGVIASKNGKLTIDLTGEKIKFQSLNGAKIEFDDRGIISTSADGMESLKTLEGTILIENKRNGRTLFLDETSPIPKRRDVRGALSLPNISYHSETYKMVTPQFIDGFFEGEFDEFIITKKINVAQMNAGFAVPVTVENLGLEATGLQDGGVIIGLEVYLPENWELGARVVGFYHNNSNGYTGVEMRVNNLSGSPFPARMLTVVIKGQIAHP